MELTVSIGTDDDDTPSKIHSTPFSERVRHDVRIYYYNVL